MTLRAATALLVGDTHANTAWLLNVLATARALDVEVVVQLGDFGVYRHAPDFLALARRARPDYGVDLWFLDGNHEEFPYLRTVAATGHRLERGVLAPVEIAPGFIYLPRGARVELAGRTVLCVGGATSVDRTMRTAGVDWFPEERLSDAEIAGAIAGGRVDILLSHDAPSGWAIPGLLSPRDMPWFWRGELDAAIEHRRRLGEVFVAVQPTVVVHGHYHSAYRLRLDREWGPVDVIGLDCDESSGWGARLRDVGGVLEIAPVVSEA